MNRQEFEETIRTAGFWYQAGTYRRRNAAGVPTGRVASVKTVAAATGISVADLVRRQWAGGPE